MTPATKRWLRPALGFAVAAVFVYLAFGRMEWSSISATLRSARPGPLLLGLLLLASGFFVRIVRWWWMLRALEPELELRSCARPFLTSLAVNNTMPLRAGDFVRAFGFRQALRSPPMRVVGTLVIERILDLFVLLSLFFAGLLGIAAGAFPPAFVTAGVALGATCLGGILVLAFAPTRLQALLRRILRSGPVAGKAWAERAGGLVDHLFDGLSLLNSPKLAAQLLGLSILAWLLEGSMFAAVAWSLSADSSPLGPWFALATGTLATLLPSSPGYVGTFDYFAILGLTAYGASRAAAAAFALLVHLILWLPVTLVGALYFVAPQQRMTLRRARNTVTSA